MMNLLEWASRNVGLTIFFVLVSAGLLVTLLGAVVNMVRALKGWDADD